LHGVPLPRPEFPHYDPDAAQVIGQHSAEVGGGLPTFLGIETVEIAPGRMVCQLPVRDDLLNTFGTLHGGVASALTDHVLGAVLYSVIERGAWAATTEFKLNLLAPIRTGIVRAEAEIVSMTRRTAVVRIDVTNDGRAAAAGQGTVSVMSPK
jgi:1,4-dihydroxy-2-naphthoyl-CoA hydrolase